MKASPVEYQHIPYTRAYVSPEDMLRRSQEFYHFMDERRTLRFFSSQPLAPEIIENIILSASTAPSGAHKQPWTFCVVTNNELKKKIREAAEEEEYKSYNGRMSEEWLEDLAPLGTDWQKPFLEEAPCLIIVFKRAYEIIHGKSRQNYYVSESTGIACGFLLAAIHHAGLVALTHTPSPMNFLQKLLKRPENERPFLLIPVGYPAANATVPELKRKTAAEVISYYR